MKGIRFETPAGEEIAVERSEEGAWSARVKSEGSTLEGLGGTQAAAVFDLLVQIEEIAGP